MTAHPVVRIYDTRLDRFRIREGIGIQDWARAAGLRRTRFNRYRTGQASPGVRILPALVRSATSLAGRPVSAYELFDLGEEVVVAPRPRGRAKGAHFVKDYGTPFDRLLHRLDVPLTQLATEAGISRKTLRTLRMKSGISVLSTIRDLVGALRRMGYPVKASDLIDTGEE